MFYKCVWMVSTLCRYHPYLKENVMIENFTLVYNLGCFVVNKDKTLTYRSHLDRFIDGLHSMFHGTPFRYKLYIDSADISVSIMQYDGKSMMPGVVFTMCSKISWLAHDCNLGEFVKINTDVELPF